MAYSLEWDPACNVQTLGSADFAAQLGLLDLAATNLTSEMQQPGGQVIGVLQDLHGDVVGLVDAQGTLLETYEYDVHGSRTLRDPATGAVVASSVLGAPAVSRWGNPLGYTGRPLSSVSGLYDLRARHYSAELRIFTAPDPLGYVDSFDLWQYTAADPLNCVDPFGMAKRRDEQEREEGASGLLLLWGLSVCGGRSQRDMLECADRHRERLTSSYGSADEAVRKMRERVRAHHSNDWKLRGRELLQLQRLRALHQQNGELILNSAREICGARSIQVVSSDPWSRLVRRGRGVRIGCSPSN